MKAQVAIASTVPAFTSVDFAKVIRPIAERWAKVALDKVLAAWPVDSGQSKGGWKVDAVVTGTDVKLVLRNPVPYAAYVTKRGDKAPLAQPLADKVIAEVSVPMNAEIEVAVADALRRARASAPRGR